MLLIILLGLIAKLMSVSGDCVVGTGDVNLNWNKFSGDRIWYYLKYAGRALGSDLSCVYMKYASPVGNNSTVTFWAYDISAQQHVTMPGYATNWNSTGWEEIYPQALSWFGRSYVIAVDYDRYVIFNYCFTDTNEMDVYVAYRERFPDEKSVDLVKKKLEENNIEYIDLADWPMTNCEDAVSSTEEEISS